MAKQVTGVETTSADIVLWTPWGEQRAERQGEKFAALIQRLQIITARLDGIWQDDVDLDR